MCINLFALAIMGLAAIAFPESTLASDRDANAVYERMQEAYASLDGAKMETVYAPDATYLPRSPKADVNTRETIRRGLSGFIDQIRSKNGTIKVSFRVIERKRFNDIVLDNGYVRTVIQPGDGTPPRTTYGKFFTAIALQPDGRWAFVSDSDSETPAASFTSAKALAGVKFDD